MEEACMISDKRLQEKMHECAQLGGELDRARDEASRAMQRAHDRTDTMRKWVLTYYPHQIVPTFNTNVPNKKSSIS